MRDSPDGKPFSELEEASNNGTATSVAAQNQENHDVTIPSAESWTDQEIRHRTSSSSSDHVSPLGHSPPVITYPPDEIRGENWLQNSPSGRFSHTFEPNERQCMSASVQTEMCESRTISSQTDMASAQDSSVSVEDLTRREAEPTTVPKESRTVGLQTDFTSVQEPVCVITEAPTLGKEKEVPFSDEQYRSLENENAPGIEEVTDNTESSHNGTHLRVERERSATSLWRKKISMALKPPEELELYGIETGGDYMYENSQNKGYFVDGVSLHVT